VSPVSLDQLPLSLLHWLVAFFPAGLQPLATMLVAVATILGFFAGFFAISTVIERKTLGRIQNRYGPNRVGPCGFLQFAADGIKSLTKEDVVPTNADHIVHYLAPVVMVIPMVALFAVLPFGRNMVATDMDAGMLYFFAVGAGAELSVFMAGWSSRNKYSLLGAMRGIAQMISYEIPLVLSAIPVVMVAGTLSLPKIVEAQGAAPGEWLANWNLFTPWGVAGFFIFLIASFAESNRSPFDLPEAESEIVAGYFTEYSGFKFALFFLAEYFGMFAISSMGITLFLGGWQAPFGLEVFQWIPSWLWYFGKLFAWLMLFIWVRGTLPRLRMDQLMGFAWKFLIPLALVNVVNAVVWRFLGEGYLRWVICATVVALAYVWLARGMSEGGKFGPRSYRYAD
jgi:NADH-quinone oxidoreductase subunit H